MTDDLIRTLEGLVAPEAQPPAPSSNAPPLDRETAPAALPTTPVRSSSRTGLKAALALGLLLLVALSGVAIGWLSGNDDPRPAANSEPGRGGERRAGGGANSDPGGDATEDAADPTEDPVDAEVSGSGNPPSGWAVYTEPTTGHSIAHPESWDVQPNSVGDGSSTDFQDPSTGAYLRVDWQQPPGPSAEQAWEDLEPSFAADHSGYSRIGEIEPTTFQGYEAAVWEFAWDEGDSRIHAVDLGFIVRDDYGFALNFVAPEEHWDALQDEFQTFQDTFVAPHG